MQLNDSYLVHWSEGPPHNLAVSRNFAGPWKNVKRIFKEPHMTPETKKAFDKLGKDDQDKLKAADGWFCGAQFEGKWRNIRNAQPRDIATIDIDYPDFPVLDLMRLGALGISGFGFVAHSTRRHTPEDPRIRIVMPLSRLVTTDEYTAVIRFIGWLIDHEMKTVDQVSYRPAQMMFKPTISRDQRKDYIYFENDGEVFDIDACFDAIREHFGDPNDLGCLPRHPDESDFREHAKKAEDPLTKRGPVGDFCRAYTIQEAMEKFIPGRYVEGDYHSGHPRYTYVGSTSSNGMIVYDDGKFAFSHHGHDPIADMNVNAFDFIRVHLFADQDKKEKYERVTDRPSFKAMVEMLQSDDGYRKSRDESRFAGLDEAFSDVEEDDETESKEHEDHATEGRDQSEATGESDSDPFAGTEEPEPDHGRDQPRDRPGDPFDAFRATWQRANDRNRDRHQTHGKRGSSWPKIEKGWLTSRVEKTNNGEIVNSVHNYITILANDTRTHGKIGFNEFTQRKVLLGTIDPKIPGIPKLICQDTENGDPWQDNYSIIIQAILDAENGVDKQGYGISVLVGKLADAIEIVARMFPIHPVREFLESCEEEGWDGVPRVPTLFPHYCGDEDNAYTREVAQLFLTAACYRAFTPGLKFDYIPILLGPQGTRKSTFVRFLFGDSFFGELHCKLDESVRVAEQIAGIWGGELPEMVSANKTEVNALKQFARRLDDNCRMAYMREVSVLKRQAVFFGTTNDPKILRDPTGNRTFWVLYTTKTIDTAELLANRRQIWAEAMHYYRAMRAEQPRGELDLDFRADEAKIEALARQAKARNFTVSEVLMQEIVDLLETPLTLGNLYSKLGMDTGAEDTLVRFVVIREKDIKRALLGNEAATTNAAAAGVMQSATDMIPGWTKTGKPSYAFGSAGNGGEMGRWITRDTASAEDRRRGYELFFPDIDEII